MELNKKITLELKSLLSTCSCSGNGCKKCAKQKETLISLYNANVPLEYWKYDVSTFDGDKRFKDTIIDYSSKMTEIYSQGTVLMLIGAFGVGKTFCGTYLLKTALQAGYSIYYSTMGEVVDNMISKENHFEFKKLMLNSDFIFIDECDGRYMPNSSNGKDIFGANLENVIRIRLHNKMPMIFGTNETDISTIFDGMFNQSFKSLFSKKNIVKIPVAGLDLRK